MSRLPVRASARCRLLGHSVHHTKINGATHCVRCGESILNQNCTSHVSHNLTCFFGGHHYVHLSRRSGHHEYVCERCGHPLVLMLDRDPYDQPNANDGYDAYLNAEGHRFIKRVAYACGLMGHRVHVVSTTSGATEYACLCGHSFVKPTSGMTVIRHPIACMVQGHLLKAHDIRDEWAEYVCCRCGHPFCFKVVRLGSVDSDQEPQSHGR